MQTPLVKIIMVSRCIEVALSSSKQFMNVHELTRNKGSEIGGRSWVYDFKKNGWDRDQRNSSPPPEALLSVPGSLKGSL